MLGLASAASQLLLKYFPHYSSSGCIPWPCFELLGNEDPKICQHYVQAPNDVKVEFLNDSNSQSDTIIVSWKPSYYGKICLLIENIYLSFIMSYPKFLSEKSNFSLGGGISMICFSLLL